MHKVKKIIIVGGGSAAWLTAGYLSNQCKDAKITVVDKHIGTPIGVGEGTLLSFRTFMTECGWDETEWFHAIDATYKAGAFFPDWVEKENSIWHPFHMSPHIEGDITLQSAWSHHQHLNIKQYGTALYENSVVHNKVDSSVIRAYAHHVDAGKLVEYIQSKLVNKVEFIQSDVVEIHKQNNKILNLKLANEQTVSADLYIDCTGFQSILREDQDRVDLLGRVFCDTAVCGQIQYIDKNTEMRPYTRAHAVDHGWLWTIPTQSRMGSGIIFNKSITSIEEAKEFFVNYWGADRTSIDSLRVIDWTPYYIKNPWSENVISIGMSSGFIEPLESTGLALIQYQISSLANVIKSKYWTEKNVSIYNTEFQIRFEDCVDFVSSHYSVTNRKEPFWQYVKDTYLHSPGILMHLDLLKDSPQSDKSYQDYQIFTGTNWTTWMAQLGYDIGADSKLDKDYALHLLMRNFETVEKYRPNWSQQHAIEIARSQEYKKYYG